MKIVNTNFINNINNNDKTIYSLDTIRMRDGSLTNVLTFLFIKIDRSNIKYRVKVNRVTNFCKQDMILFIRKILFDPAVIYDQHFLIQL